MNEYLYLILGTLCIQGSVSEDEFPPTPPDSYTAEIQYNFEGSFFIKDEKVKGISLYAVENVDNVHNRTEISWHFETQFEALAFGSSKRFIWDPRLTIANNYIVIQTTTSPFSPGHTLSCSADPELKEPIEEIALGFSNNKPSRPSINGLLYFGKEKFTKVGEDMANQIPCIKYTKNIDELFGAKYNIKANVTVYWSDPSKWHGSAGRERPVPVYATIIGKIENEDANIYMSYVDYYEASHDGVFKPIPDLLCDNSVGEKGPVPVADDRFMFQGEFLIHYLDHSRMNQYILPTVEYYDFTDHVSIHEYKTVNFSTQDPFSQAGKFVRDLLDFQSGLIYKMDFVDGQCRVSDLNLDASFGDLEVDEHGHIQMMSPGDFWGADKDHFVIKGITHRGLSGSSYLHRKESLEQVVATYFDETEKYRPIPVRILTYPYKGYNSLANRRELNIFGYESNPSLEFPMDITQCFSGEHLSHRILASSWTPEMMIHNEDRFVKEVVRRTLSQKAQIIHLRIQNMEILHIDEEKKAIHFIFTLLDVHPALNVTKDLPEEVTNSLSTALKNLETALAEGKVIFYFDGPNGKTIKSTPVSGSFQDTTRDEPKEPTYGLKYSSGSMTVLGIFMTIFGIVGGLFGYHYYTKSPYFRG